MASEIVRSQESGVGRHCEQSEASQESMSLQAKRVIAGKAKQTAKQVGVLQTTVIIFSQLPESTE
jgi:hypothetical protein